MRDRLRRARDIMYNESTLFQCLEIQMLTLSDLNA